MTRRVLQLVICFLGSTGMLVVGGTAASAAQDQVQSATGFVFGPFGNPPPGTSDCPTTATPPFVVVWNGGTAVFNANSLNVTGPATFYENASSSSPGTPLYTGHAHFWATYDTNNSTVSFDGADSSGNTLVFESSTSTDGHTQVRADCN